MTPLFLRCIGRRATGSYSAPKKKPLKKQSNKAIRRLRKKEIWK